MELNRKNTNIMQDSHPKIIYKIIELLKENGHGCAIIENTKNHTFKWCQQELCENKSGQQNNENFNKELKFQDIIRKDEEQREFGRQLKEKGHTCLIYSECFPVHLIWCEQEICENKI